MKKYEFLEHTADIKFRAYGKSLSQLFENSALALAEYLSRGNKIKSKLKKKISLSGNNLESLYYNFLEEVIFLLDAESFIISKAKVNAEKDKVTAEFSGDLTKNYEGLDHIKAVTYSQMYVKKTAKGYEAQAVVDV